MQGTAPFGAQPPKMARAPAAGHCTPALAPLAPRRRCVGLWRGSDPFRWLCRHAPGPCAARGAGRGARGVCDVSFAPVLQAAFKILRCMSSRALEVNHFHLGAAVMACEKATRCACGMRGVARVAGFGVANGAQPEPRGAWNASCRVLVCSDLPP